MITIKIKITLSELKNPVDGSVLIEVLGWELLCLHYIALTSELLAAFE